MTQNFNITRLPHAPSAPQSGNGQASKDVISKTKIATDPMVRSLPPLTKYNHETGLAEPIDDLGALPQDDEVAPPARSEETEKQQTDRHTKWKQDQAAKKEVREQAKTTKAAEAQVLAKDLLKKGDLVGAANALGMSPSDLALAVDNARLGIAPPTQEEVKLTPEQQKTADEEKFRQDRLSFEKEQRDWKYQTIASQYIKDNIDPVLNDQDTYEYIHKVADVTKIKNYVYEYMNKHYQETCTFNEETKQWNQDGEQLSPKDVLETIENNFYTNHVAALEKAKDIKKVAKYFSPPQAQEVEEEEIQEAPVNLADPWARKRTPDIKRTLPTTRSRNDLQISQEKPMDLSQEAVSNVKTSALPKMDRTSSNWRSLSRQEQIKIAQREMEEEDRRASR